MLRRLDAQPEPCELARMTQVSANECRAGDMYDMRARLLSAHAADERGHAADLSRQLNDASQLASALSKLSSTENQLRQVQATLIAERVARTQVEQEHDLHVGDARGIKTELAGAVRALRKAKFEGKRVEEERRRLARAFEEAKTQSVSHTSSVHYCQPDFRLYRYHEELKVRDARAMGREEGRQEVSCAPCSTLYTSNAPTGMAGSRKMDGWLPTDTGRSSALSARCCLTPDANAGAPTHASPGIPPSSPSVLCATCSARAAILCSASQRAANDGTAVASPSVRHAVPDSSIHPAINSGSHVCPTCADIFASKPGDARTTAPMAAVCVPACWPRSCAAVAGWTCWSVYGPANTSTPSA